MNVDERTTPSAASVITSGKAVELAILRKGLFGLAMLKWLPNRPLRTIASSTALPSGSIYLFCLLCVWFLACYSGFLPFGLPSCLFAGWTDYCDFDLFACD